MLLFMDIWVLFEGVGGREDGISLPLYESPLQHSDYFVLFYTISGLLIASTHLIAILLCSMYNVFCITFVLGLSYMSSVLITQSPLQYTLDLFIRNYTHLLPFPSPWVQQPHVI